MSRHHHHERLEELAHDIRRLVREILGDDMSQVQYTLTLTITPATPPLSESATSGSLSIQAGAPVSDLPVGDTITGGQPPYVASVDPASPNQLPDGLSVSVDANGNLNLTGTATTSGTGTILIDVNDSGS
jgi:hypothetical protein